MLIEPSRIMDSFEFRMETMSMADVSRLHELSICVNWPHRARDWEILQDFGQGLVIKDEIDRILGSAMWYPIGDDLASIGMVITSPRLQKHGAGTWLMSEILQQTRDREKILNATKAAYPLYISFDFQPLKRVHQHNGIVTSLPDGPDLSRPFEADDFDSIVALDEEAFGGNRRNILEKLKTLSDISVLERDGKLVGFAMRRNFGKGHVIGPVVAYSQEDTLSLIRPHVAALKGRFARLDTRETQGPLPQFLSDAGIALDDKVTTMTLGTEPKTGPAKTFGLVSQALG